MKFLRITLSLLIIFSSSFSNAQFQVILQPNAIAGKDAVISSDYTTLNIGSHVDFDAYAWTVGGVFTILRSLIQFDISTVPVNSIITSATLTLYNNPTSSSTNAIHQSLTGSNMGYFEKITQPWNEMTVTWATQPNTTPINRIILPQSTSPHQDYVLDVTSFVQDAYLNPSTSFGWMLKLQTEINYRSLIFASSDNANPSKWPKLVINYTRMSDLTENENDAVRFFPNPVSDNKVTVILNQESDISIYNLAGELIYEKMNLSIGGFEMNTLNWGNGTYLMKVRQGDQVITRKIVIL